MTPDSTEPTRAKADLAPVSANEPQRSAEVQAAMDWLMPSAEWDKLDEDRKTKVCAIVKCNGAKAGRILRAEVLRLEQQLAAEKARADAAESQRDGLGQDLDAKIEHLERVLIQRSEAREEVARLQTERDKLRETLVAIKAVNVDEHGQVGDEAINRLIDTCPAPATTPKGATQP